ncbi:MAG: tRNA (adenosine(37)-N6)-threonylcarbamoyltransferase complex ATPase subunit type 1 TsaE [Thermoanaerobaculia bacterium]|nr:tRNA (adenosine(37)-N6)-threonylcarbamoyltransferase complex ATPase subunit type 1 TsaE [Thermoanaerobaculia bacterium]
MTGRRWESRSEDETRALAARLAAAAAADTVFLLYGPMGSGKTVFAQGVAEGLGIDAGQVQSPTFTLVREHEGPKGRLIHMDLYRLTAEELPELAVEELLATPGVKVVEWAERLPAAARAGGVGYRLDLAGEGRRLVVEIGMAEGTSGEHDGD